MMEDQEPLVLQVYQETQVLLDHRVELVLLVQLVCKVVMASLVQLDLKVEQDLQEQLV